MELFGYELENVPAVIITYVIALVLVFVIFSRMENAVEGSINIVVKILVPVVLLPVAYFITQMMANRGN